MELHTRTRDERSVTELLKDLRDETTALLQQEVALAKTEMSEKVSRIGRNAAYLAVGGAIAFAGLMFLLQAVNNLVELGLIRAGLSEETAVWVAPLIVGAVVALIGYALVQKAITTLKHEPIVPQKTVDSLEENKQWVKQKAK